MSEHEIDERMVTPNATKESTVEHNESNTIGWFEATLGLFEVPTPPTSQCLAACFDEFEP